MICFRCTKRFLCGTFT